MGLTPSLIPRAPLLSFFFFVLWLRSVQYMRKKKQGSLYHMSVHKVNIVGEADIQICTCTN